MNDQAFIDRMRQLSQEVIDELRTNYLPNRDRVAIGALSTHMLLYADLLTQDSDAESLILKAERVAPEVYDAYFANQTELSRYLNNHATVNQVAIANILMFQCRESGIYEFNDLQRKLLRLIRITEQANDITATLDLTFEGHARFFYAARAMIYRDEEARVVYDDEPLADPHPVLFPQNVTAKDRNSRYLFGEQA